jgi:PBP1b-binding outer membrane lipoprotein LpoB
VIPRKNLAKIKKDASLATQIYLGIEFILLCPVFITQIRDRLDDTAHNVLAVLIILSTILFFKFCPADPSLAEEVREHQEKEEQRINAMQSRKRLLNMKRTGVPSALANPSVLTIGPDVLCANFRTNISNSDNTLTKRKAVSQSLSSSSSIARHHAILPGDAARSSQGATISQENKQVSKSFLPGSECNYATRDPC